MQCPKRTQLGRELLWLRFQAARIALHSDGDLSMGEEGFYCAGAAERALQYLAVGAFVGIGASDQLPTVMTHADVRWIKGISDLLVNICANSARSLQSTIKNLFNLSTFLTKRDAWAGNLEELLLDEPRTDAPLHFPESPPVASPWTVGPGGVPLPPVSPLRVECCFLTNSSEIQSLLRCGREVTALLLALRLRSWQTPRAGDTAARG